MAVYTVVVARRTETILFSAVVLAYGSGLLAATVGKIRFYALPSFCRSVTTCRECLPSQQGCRLAGDVLASPRRCGYSLLISAVFSVNFSRFTRYFQPKGSVDTSTSSLKVIPFTWFTHTCPSPDIRAPTLDYATLLCPPYFHP